MAPFGAVRGVGIEAKLLNIYLYLSFGTTAIFVISGNGCPQNGQSHRSIYFFMLKADLTIHGWYLLTEKLTGSRVKFARNGKRINRN